MTFHNAFSKTIFILSFMLAAFALIPSSANARTTDVTVAGSICLTDSDCKNPSDFSCEPLGTGYRLKQEGTTGLVPASEDFTYHKICKMKNNVEGCAEINLNTNAKAQKNGVAAETAINENDDNFCSSPLLCDSTRGTNGTCTQFFGKDEVKNLDVGEETSDIKSKVLRFVNLALSFLAILGVVIIIYAGAAWASSLGNEDRVTKARKTLIAAAIGLVIITIAWTITSYIINFGGQLT